MTMSLFLLTFFLIYGGTHRYFFLKVKGAVNFGTGAGVCLALFLLLMTMAPALVRVLEREGKEAAARLMAYTGYMWMGFLFLFSSVSLALDLYRGLLYVARLVTHRDLTLFSLSPRAALAIPLAWGVGAAVYGYFEALDIRTEHLVITTPKIPRTAGTLTIVLITDVHLGLIVREKRLCMILDRVREAAPDILVSTGDLVDGQISGLTRLAELLREIKPRYGKFAVTGNHEFYAGLGEALRFKEQAGFRVLRDEEVQVAGSIRIAGVDDPVVERGGRHRTITEEALLAKSPPDKFTLLLKHRPAVNRNSLGLFDLQLSGHVHKGQLFPFNLLTYLFYPVRSGYNLYPQNSALYVGRGSGTWGPPIRFLAPPEVTVIELVGTGR
jgi:uncharacterized protein